MTSVQLLPVETLANVFSLCSYIDLLSVSAVCRVWKIIVESDPCLRVQTFKSTGNDIEGQTSLINPTPVHEIIQIHPVIMKVSYRMGDELASAGFPCENPSTAQLRPLSDLAVSADFATIPAITSMNIEVKRPSCTCCRPTILSFIVGVQNISGIRVLDIFSALAKE
ncbi:hypothetical protein BDZ94DRAFT_239325 [Collybia nuda]|uniref:F-box domain-containing protein n=1 Tax=Collybia nuda TaxID=64659 RepID=A0A9P5YC88_9AGAR|nr:hypothetical protein BDZ94DRAFT_239325 [Collybia nuda]